MRHTRVGDAAVLMLVWVLLAAPAGAQGVAQRSSPVLPATDATRDSVTNLAAVSVLRAKPRSFHVVTIPLPADFGSADSVRFDVEALGGAAVLGQLHGLTTEKIVLTLGVSSRALAGRTTVAAATFRRGAVVRRVPVDIDVERQSLITVQLERATVGATAGAELRLSLSVVNAGNALDSVRALVQAPLGWKARASKTDAFPLVPGGSARIGLELLIPPTEGEGSHAVQITLIPSSDTTARVNAEVSVEVMQSGRVAARGPQFTLNVVAAATADSTPPALLQSLAIAGPVADGLDASGLINFGGTPPPFAQRSLSQLGFGARTNYFTLNARHWGATVGGTGFSTSPLAGESVYGRGASFGLRAGRWRAIAIRATPARSMLDESGTMQAAQSEYRAPSFSISTSVAHLREIGAFKRRLDAFSLGGAYHPSMALDVAGEIGKRYFDAGNGLGLVADVRRRSSGGEYHVRLVDAPGGSSAYAQTASGLYADVTQRAGDRFRVETSTWRTRDANPAFTSLVSTGWSVVPRFDVTSSLRFGAEARRSGVSSTGSTGGFASRQETYGATTELVRSRIRASAGGSWNVSLRDVTGIDGVSLRETVARPALRGDATYFARRGVVAVAADAQAASSNGFSPGQSVLTARAERLQPVSRFTRLTFDAMLERFSYGSNTSMTKRIVAGLVIAAGTRLSVAAEQGTLTGFGRRGTVYSARLERTAGLTLPDGRSGGGVVYVDRNGNGHRDPDEPGFAGVVVRRGNETAVTDQLGEFQFATSAHIATTLDARSVPDGWVTAPGTSGDDANIGIVPLGSVVVQPVLALASDRATNVRLGLVTVTLTDSAGRTWVARGGEARPAMFDALPSGTYSVTVDVSGASEPLIVDVVPAIHVSRTTGLARILVTIRQRPVRLQRFAPSEPPR